METGEKTLRDITGALEDFKKELPKYGWFPGPGESLEWWAGYRDPFHIAVTAVLVKLSRWEQADATLRRLTSMGLGEPRALANASLELVEGALKSVSLWRSKAQTLKELSKLFLSHDLAREDVREGRRLLLNVHGVGYETADSILLFAFNKSTMPVSRQTLRILGRVGLKLGASYERVRLGILESLGGDVYMLKLLHSSMTVIARVYCKAKATKCGSCPLKRACNHALETSQGRIIVES
ncbi:MAG: hypothetical protein P3X22_007210 [Thermoprotei archaeon]|nr:hypothetical protein [Thermoprotei archaeon]